MKGTMNTKNQGKTDTPMGKMSGKGGGMTKRDASVAKPVSGGGTKHIVSGQVNRTKGSFKSYR